MVNGDVFAHGGGRNRNAQVYEVPSFPATAVRPADRFG